MMVFFYWDVEQPIEDLPEDKLAENTIDEHEQESAVMLEEQIRETPPVVENNENGKNAHAEANADAADNNDGDGVKNIIEFHGDVMPDDETTPPSQDVAARKDQGASDEGVDAFIDECRGVEDEGLGAPVMENLAKDFFDGDSADSMYHSHEVHNEHDELLSGTHNDDQHAPEDLSGIETEAESSEAADGRQYSLLPNRAANYN